MVVINDKKLDLNPQFLETIKKMEDPEGHLFITGKAGSGKSTLLTYFCEITNKDFAILAPTGVAALNVGGITIHRFFNFYVDVTPDQVSKGQYKPKKNKQLFENLRVIIIDEVSMLRADLLDCIEIFLRKYGFRPGLPFGGVKMIFIGDLYQLPPVVGSKEKEIFDGYYKSPYFFSSHGLANIDVEIVELEKIYRQKDQEFINLLNKIRNNSVTDRDISLLNKRYIEDFVQSKSEFYINLTSTNSKADQINSEYLSRIENKLYKSKALISGSFDKSSYPTSPELEFKAGSQIMMLNNDPNGKWVNGSIGIIETCKKREDDIFLVVYFPDIKKSYVVKRHQWEISRYYFDGTTIQSETVGSFEQFPFRLAWAITIHKSQGKTFDNVIIDMGGGDFATGQMYVALSRCTSFEGVVLKKIAKSSHIRTDYRIFKFLTEHHYKKSEEEMSLDDKVDFIRDAIEKNQEIKMVYLKANDVKSERVIIPYFVGEEKYQKKPFLGVKAFCKERREDRVFRVDRILSMSISNL